MKYISVKNPFIGGDKDGLNGELRILRLYYDLNISLFKSKFIKVKPMMGVGVGFTEINIKKILASGVGIDDVYIYKSYSLNLFPRIRIYMFDLIFIEIPASDVFINIWTNSNKDNILDTTQIHYPDWGGIFLWMNIGVSFKF